MIFWDKHLFPDLASLCHSLVRHTFGELLLKRKCERQFDFMKHHLISKRFIALLFSCVIISSCKNSNTTIAKVDYAFSGCFASGSSILVLYKLNDSTMARLVEENSTVQKVKLNSLQLDTFNLFVQELRVLKETSFCTTTNHYKVSIGNEVIDKIDVGCSWDGFGRIKKCLFGQVN